MNALRADGATLREALHAEWTKLRTVPSTGWLLLTLIVLTVGASALATVVVKCPASCGEDTTKLSLTGILLGQAAVAVLAVLVMSGEYSSGMIRVTLTAVPRRATALRDSGASIAVMLGLLYIVPLLTDLGTLDPRWERRLQQWGPMTAGLAIQATKNLKKLPIGPWPGLGVLAAWTAAALLAGGLLLRLRDA